MVLRVCRPAARSPQMAELVIITTAALEALEWEGSGKVMV